MRRITELAVNRPDVYYPVRKNTKPFNRKYFFFPCVSTHTHIKSKNYAENTRIYYEM